MKWKGRIWALCTLVNETDLQLGIDLQCNSTTWVLQLQYYVKVLLCIGITVETGYIVALCTTLK